MKVYLEATILAVSKGKPFVDKTTGKTQEAKFKTVLKNEEGELLSLNCKTDYTKYESMEGVAQLGVYEQNQSQGKGYWLSLIEFIPQKDERTIE